MSPTSRLRECCRAYRLSVDFWTVPIGREFPQSTPATGIILFPPSTADAAANILVGNGLSPEANQGRFSTPPPAPTVPVGVSQPTTEALLQDAMCLIENLAGVVQNNQQNPAQVGKPRVKVDMLKYTGYHDSASANDYLDRLQHYQQATGLMEAEILARVVPVSPTDQAARWFRLVGEQTRTIESFRAKFREEFLPTNYEWRLRREFDESSGSLMTQMSPCWST